MNKEKKERLYDKNDSLELFRLEITYLRKTISDREIKILKKRLKRLKNKLIARKKKEAFPRKSGKYNELFQDFGKESWSRDNSGQTT